MRVLAGFLAKGGFDKINNSIKENKNSETSIIVDENEKFIKKDSPNNKKDK